VVAAIGASHWVTRLELLQVGEGEELVGSPPQIVHKGVRYAVPRDGEKPDLFAGRIDLPSHVLPIRPIPGAGYGEVDDRDLDHGRTSCARGELARAATTLVENIDPVW